MSTPDTRTLTKKIALIMGALGPLPRTGEKRGATRAGGEFAYDVFLEGDILQPVQKALAAHGVVIVPETVAVDRRELPSDKPDRPPLRLVDELVRYTVHDADSDQTLVGQMPGSAEERDGSGISKALTDSNKNFLRKLFQIAAQEGNAPRAQSGPIPTNTAGQSQATTTVDEKTAHVSGVLRQVMDATKNGRKYQWAQIDAVQYVVFDAGLFDTLHRAENTRVEVEIQRTTKGRYGVISKLLSATKGTV